MAMEERNAELIRLVSAFERSEETKDTVQECLVFLKEFISRDASVTFHSKLCNAMLKVIKGGGQDYTELLRYAGPVQTLIVIHSNLTHVA